MAVITTYHGTHREFDSVDNTFFQKGGDSHSAYGIGFYVSQYPEYATSHIKERIRDGWTEGAGGVVYEIDLEVDDSRILNKYEKITPEQLDAFVRSSRELGYTKVADYLEENYSAEKLPGGGDITNAIEVLVEQDSTGSSNAARAAGQQASFAILTRSGIDAVFHDTLNVDSAMYTIMNTDIIKGSPRVLEVIGSGPIPMQKAEKPAAQPAEVKPAAAAEAQKPAAYQARSVISGGAMSLEYAGEKPDGYLKGFMGRDPATNDLYVLKEMSEGHARSEVLASKLYREAGVDVPDMDVVEIDGKTYVASKFIENLSISPKQGDNSSLRQGFAADAWLANWDVSKAGNIEYNQQGGAVRLDLGSTLEYRSRGGQKGSSFGNTANEMDSLRNPDKNDYAHVFKDVTDADIKVGAERIAAIPDERLKEIIDTYGPKDASARESLFDTLNERRADIQQRAGIVPDAKPSVEARTAEAPKQEALKIKAYHGATSQFDAIDFSRLGEGSGHSVAGFGFYVAPEVHVDRPDISQSYARDHLKGHQGGNGVIYEMELTLDPARVIDISKPADPALVEKLANIAAKNGHSDLALELKSGRPDGFSIVVPKPADSSIQVGGMVWGRSSDIGMEGHSALEFKKDNGGLMAALEAYTGSPKAASAMLREAGIDGISAYGNSITIINSDMIKPGSFQVMEVVGNGAPPSPSSTQAALPENEFWNGALTKAGRYPGLAEAEVDKTIDALKQGRNPNEIRDLTERLNTISPGLGDYARNAQSPSFEDFKQQKLADILPSTKPADMGNARDVEIERLRAEASWYKGFDMDSQMWAARDKIKELEAQSVPADPPLRVQPEPAPAPAAAPLQTQAETALPDVEPQEKSNRIQQIETRIEIENQRGVLALAEMGGDTALQAEANAKLVELEAKMEALEIEAAAKAERLQSEVAELRVEAPAQPAAAAVGAAAPASAPVNAEPARSAHIQDYIDQRRAYAQTRYELQHGSLDGFEFDAHKHERMTMRHYEFEDPVVAEAGIRAEAAEYAQKNQLLKDYGTSIREFNTTVDEVAGISEPRTVSGRAVLSRFDRAMEDGGFDRVASDIEGYNTPRESIKAAISAATETARLNSGGLPSSEKWRASQLRGLDGHEVAGEIEKIVYDNRVAKFGEAEVWKQDREAAAAKAAAIPAAVQGAVENVADVAGDALKAAGAVAVAVEAVDKGLEQNAPEKPTAEADGRIIVDVPQIEAPESRGLLARGADALGEMGSKGNILVGGAFGALAAGMVLVDTGDVKAAANAFEDALNPYAETSENLMAGDLEAAGRSAKIETATEIGSLVAGAAVVAAGAAAGVAIGAIAAPAIVVGAAGMAVVVGASMVGGYVAGGLTESILDNGIAGTAQNMWDSTVEFAQSIDPLSVAKLAPGVGAVITAVDLVREHGQDVLNTAMTSMDSVGDAIADTGAEIAGTVIDGLDSVKDAILGGLDTAKDTALGAAANAVTGVREAMADQAKSVWEGFSNLFNDKSGVDLDGLQMADNMSGMEMQSGMPVVKVDLVGADDSMAIKIDPSEIPVFSAGNDDAFCGPSDLLGDIQGAGLCDEDMIPTVIADAGLHASTSSYAAIRKM